MYTGYHIYYNYNNNETKSHYKLLNSTNYTKHKHSCIHTSHTRRKTAIWNNINQPRTARDKAMRSSRGHVVTVINYFFATIAELSEISQCWSGVVVSAYGLRLTKWIYVGPGWYWDGRPYPCSIPGAGHPVCNQPATQGQLRLLSLWGR